MRISFVHDWEMPVNEYLDNEDGLPKAIQLIAQNHNLQWITNGQNLTMSMGKYTLNSVPNEATLISLIKAHSPDVIVCWGGLDRPHWKLFHEVFKSTPKVLCFAGGPRHHIAKSYFNVIVCESQCYIDDFTRVGVTAVRGFGTNIDVFRPLGLPKVWNAIYPASLCFHKNIELFARTFEGSGLCVGNHNENTIVSKVLSFGTPLMHRVNSRTLADLYNMSRVTVITAGPEGGAQRVVLESMACGIPVIVMSDHDRCIEFVEESRFGRVCHPVDTDIRETVQDLLNNMPDKFIGVNYIKSKWSQDHYAAAIIDACKKAMMN